MQRKVPMDGYRSLREAVTIETFAYVPIAVLRTFSPELVVPFEPAPAPSPARAHDPDFVVIRGRRLGLRELFDPGAFTAARQAEWREAMASAKPFAHLVLDRLFNPDLLRLVHEEFDLYGQRQWRVVHSPQETTHRSLPEVALGPASELYFGLVNSRWFLQLLSTVSGVDDLITDPGLYGGGLHETRKGGHFGIHRDFDRHPCSGLDNEMVFITYLNEDWNAQWGGALELWDGQAKRCVSAVEPVFGRSVLLRHGAASFHGHPAPLNVPEGRSRRSVASYYYSYSLARRAREHRNTSVFLFSERHARLKQAAKRATPPAVWDALRRLVGG